MTVTSKLHTQEYRDIELNIVVDEIGPGEGLLDSGGSEIPLKPAGKGGVAQFPAGKDERRWILLKRPRCDRDGMGGREVTVTSRLHRQKDKERQRKTEERGDRRPAVAPGAGVRWRGSRTGYEDRGQEPT